MSEIEESSLRKAQEAFARIPYIKLLGMELVELKIGQAVLRLKVRDKLRQPQGLLHGGATASVIDTATGFAVVSVLAEGETRRRRNQKRRFPLRQESRKFIRRNLSSKPLITAKNST